jgi:hypothetical protein
MYPLSVDFGVCPPYVGRVQVHQAHSGTYHILDEAAGLAPGRVEPNQHDLSMVLTGPVGWHCSPCRLHPYI